MIEIFQRSHVYNKAMSLLEWQKQGIFSRKRANLPLTKNVSCLQNVYGIDRIIFCSRPGLGLVLLSQIVLTLCSGGDEDD